MVDFLGTDNRAPTEVGGPEEVVAEERLPGRGPAVAGRPCRACGAGKSAIRPLAGSVLPAQCRQMKEQLQACMFTGMITDLFSQVQRISQDATWTWPF